MATRSELRGLVKKACAKPMTSEARDRQIVSFAFGNARLENDRVTKLLVREARAKKTH